ncbi:U3 small nucleolar ribonucleoprotein MPP10, partial [Asbolus verrucosus]
ATEELCNGIKDKLKETYDFAKNDEIKALKSNALPELILENFDLEQIWQQIELQNDSLLTRSLATVSKLVVGKNNLLFKNLDYENDKEDEDEILENDNEESPASEEDLSDVDSGDDRPTEVSTKKIKPSIVDDEFFKLGEMEQFLNAEEKKLNEPDSGNDSDDSETESEENVDLFEAEDDEDDKMRTARYKDFFVSREETRKQPRNKFLEEMEDETAPKSSFELRQDRLTQKIEEIEEDVVREKPWQLKGEIRGDSRPQNSLLEEVVEFDLTTRPAPVITEQTTMQLEDIIKQRIKDRAFDSVERKAKPVDTPLEYKKKLVLDQEKSKESLAKIYEKEYLEQQAALDLDNGEKEEKEPELHQEINSTMASLFAKLDALSNFHFTPKPAIPELKIVSNLPAITMEEVAPVAMSDATLLAPEEVKAKAKGDVAGKNERTTTDKKRERRKKKLKQKIHVKQKQKRENLVKMKAGFGNKYNRENTKKEIEKVTKEKNVDKMDESRGKAVKSTKAFFTQLQEEVKLQIKRKSSDRQDKKKNAPISAKGLKL